MYIYLQHLHRITKWNHDEIHQQQIIPSFTSTSYPFDSRDTSPGSAVSQPAQVPMTVTWRDSLIFIYGSETSNCDQLWCPLDSSMIGDVYVTWRPGLHVQSSVTSSCLARILSMTQIAPLPPVGDIWDVMLVWRKGNINKNCLCVTVLCTIIMVHKDTSSSYRSVDCIGLWSCLV